MGKYNLYTINDIVEGDEVYFDSESGQTNYDEYWTVTGTDKRSKVHIKLEYPGGPYYWSVDVSDIRMLMTHSNKNRKKN